MMKKLLMWSALLMTGFAFYSCDDVVDNPVQNDSAVWNYSVTVKFADFDFKGLVDPVSGEKYAYEAPKTLYVFNEELEPLGTIATNTPPTAGGSAKYEGKLHGAIGNNLIITTKTGVDYAKQDGTIESAIENGIVQTAKVAVRLYSNYNYNLSTYDANMENEVAIAHLNISWLKNGDELKISSDNIANEDKSLTFIIPEDITASNLYVAIPTNDSKEYDYSIDVNTVSGEVAEATFEDLKLEKGKYNTLNYETDEPFHMWDENVKSVDLTKWYAWANKDNPNPTGEQWYTIWDNGIILTQSGTETLDSLSISCWTGFAEGCTITFNNINIGKDRVISFGPNDYILKAIGENKIGTLYLQGKTTCKTSGDGNIEFNEIKLDGWAPTMLSEFTIEKDMKLEHIWSNWGKLTIKDGVKVEASNSSEDKDDPVIVVRAGSILNVGANASLEVVNNDKDKNSPAMHIDGGTLKIGKGSTFNVENKANERPALAIDNGEFEVADNGTVTIQSAIDASAIAINESATIKLGKLANMTVTGGTLSPAINIWFPDNKNETYTFTLDEGATLTAQGNDRPGISISGGCDNFTANTIFTIAKDAKVISEALGKENGFDINCWGNYPMNLTISGKGTFEAKSAKGTGMFLNTEGTVYFKDGINLLATGGKDSPAIAYGWAQPTFDIAKTITKIIATSGMTTNPVCIADNNGDELNLGLAAADFDDDMGLDKNNEPTGVRTITPKAK